MSPSRNGASSQRLVKTIASIPRLIGFMRS
jgi:hypothetical protein